MSVKINELATKPLEYSSLFASADENGVAYRNTLLEIQSYLNVANSVSFKGDLTINEAATISVDGWYFAAETGDYIVGGVTTAVSISNNLVVLIISDSDTTAVLNKVDIPLNITFDTTPTEGSTGAVESGGIVNYVASEKYNINSYRINESASSPSFTTLNLLSTELLPNGYIKNVKINISTIGNIKFAAFRRLDTLKYQLIESFDYDITATGVQTLDVNYKIDEDFYFGVLNGSVATFNTEGTNVGDPFNLNYFSGTFNDSSLWTESLGRTANIEINVLKNEFVNYVNSLNKKTFDSLNDVETSTMKAVSDYIDTKIITNDLVNSFAYNNTYATASSSSLNLTSSELLPKGIIKTITLKAVSDGVCRFAFLRQLTATPTYKPIKYFECSVVSGENIIKVNEFIDEDFHLCLLNGSASIYTASTNVGDPLDLHFFNGDFTDSSTWTITSGRGTNIQSDINVNPLDFPTKTIGKSITYCGDSITDFCDSPSSNGVQYLGFDAHIDRYLKFNIKNIYGFSGIKLGQSSGFANSRVTGMPTSDYYVIYLGTNDFALATQTTLGSVSDYDNSTGVNTFFGAFRTLVDAIYTKNSYAKIICFTPNQRDYSSLNSWNSANSNGNTLNDFSESIRTICNFNGFYLVDLMKEAQINRNNFSLTTYDNLHPNTRGYQEIAESFIIELYNKF